MKKAVLMVVGMLMLLAGLACNLTAAAEPTATPLPSETPSPQASATALPSDTPDPAANLPRVRITTELNVRSGPSADCPVIGVLAQNLEIPVYAITPERTWWQVQLGTGQTGWINAAFTTPVNDVSSVPTLAGPVCQPAATHTATPTGTLPPSPTYTATSPASPTPTATTFIIGPIVTLPGPILILPSKTPTPFFIGPIVTLPGPILILPTATPP